MAATNVALSATYHESGDRVVVETSLRDGTDTPLDPAEVRSLAVYLLKRGTTLESVTGLTKFHADENLAFTVCFNHPTDVRGLRVKAVFVERSTELTWSHEVEVGTRYFTASESELSDNRAQVVRS